MSADDFLKKTADKMMQSSARVMGVVFETHAKYIEQREGKEGMAAVEAKTTELGYPIKFREIKTFEYYPVGLADLIIITAKELFGWGEKDIFDMGNTAPKQSFLVKLLLRYFVSLEKSLQESSKYWKKHFTEGELEYELDKEKKEVVIHLKYKTTHPLICVFYKGYFLRMAQYVIKSPKIYIEEKHCMFKGSACHDYFITWK